MKSHRISAVILMVMLPSIGLAQHKDKDDKVTIREDVSTLKSSGDPKAEITIRQPSVSGLKNGVALKKLQDALTPNSVFEYSLDEVFDGSSGITSVDFKVNYNQHYLLDIDLWMETMGAYPSTITVHKIINLKTGEPLKASEVFNQQMLPQLAEKVRALKKRKEKESLEDPHDSQEDKESIEEGIRSARAYDLTDLDHFSVSDKGITFLYDYDTFPHVIQNLQPPGSYFISFKELKPFINPHGPLGVFREE
jgi:hypothetical protein